MGFSKWEARHFTVSIEVGKILWDFYRILLYIENCTVSMGFMRSSGETGTHFEGDEVVESPNFK